MWAIFSKFISKERFQKNRIISLFADTTSNCFLKMLMKSLDDECGGLGKLTQMENFD